MTPRVDRLLIKVNEQPSGYLSKEETSRGGRKYVFSYLPDTRPEIAVSKTMPVRSESYTLGFLHPIFEMSQPEGLLKDHLVNRFGKILNMDDMGLLFLTGRSRIGNVTAEINPQNEDETLIDVARRIRQKEEDEHPLSGEMLTQSDENEWVELFDNLLENYAVSSGVGGMQPKILAEVDGLGFGDDDRLTAITSSHIVKSSYGEYPYLGLNESLCLRVAERMGFEIPQHYLGGNGQVIIVERFDLKNEGGRYAIEDGCVLQALATDEKYNSTVERLVDSLLTYLPEERRRESAKKIFMMTTLNALVRNGDAHLKNFAIIYDHPDDARLTLPYDITTTKAYPSLREDISALMMNHTRRWPTIKELIRFGKASCHLREGECTEIIDRAITSATDIGNTVPDVIKLFPGSQNVCCAMVSCWNDGIKSLYFKKDGQKRKFRTGLDDPEKFLWKEYGDPYTNQLEEGALRQTKLHEDRGFEP